MTHSMWIWEYVHLLWQKYEIHTYEVWVFFSGYIWKKIYRKKNIFVLYMLSIDELINSVYNTKENYFVFVKISL